MVCAARLLGFGISHSTRITQWSEY
jgi:hypothetical protein